MGRNNSYVADMAFEEVPYSKAYVKVAALLYFSHHMLKINVTKTPPIDTSIIGKFRESELFPDAPYLCGDIMSNDEVPRKIGYINSDQNETGETLYWVKFSESVDNGWYKIKLEDV